MQARKLSLGEAHPSQVVKVEVDVASQCTAILLRSSSCLLFPSLASSSSSPSLSIPSCTDICFLRLRQRSTPLSSSSSSDKSAESTFRSDPRNLANVKGKPSMHVSERISNGLPVVASMGNVAEGSVHESLLLLALRPAKGRISTDLLAWRCNGKEIFQTLISFDGFADGCMARLEDIPHGISVGIAASINVVAVHSPATGKLWIFSAKESSTRSHGVRPSHVQKGPMQDKSAQVALEVDREKNEKENSFRLQILKCAVVDCNGPVYSMHLSLQHLLVGQLGGIRVWPLRPLIKGSEVARKDSKATLSMRHERIKSSEDEEFGKKTVDMGRESNDQHPAAVEGIGAASTVKVLCPVVAAPINGLYELSVNHCIGTSSASMNGYSSKGGNFTIKKQGWGCSGKASAEVSACSHHGCIKLNTNVDVQQPVFSNASKPIQFEIAAVPRYKNGTFLECDSEDFKSEHKFSQFSTLSSSSDSSSSLLPPQNTYVRSGSCQSLTSSLSSVSGVPGTISASYKSEYRKRISAGVFILLQKTKPVISPKVEQVISIHGLSEKDFLILDSSGKLHALTLQYVMHKDEGTIHQAPRVLLNASVQHLMCGIRIKYLSVLPDLHDSTKSPGYAPRKLWISDGSHTVHIVIIPPRELSKEGSEKAHVFSKDYLSVTGTVFLMEHACLLSALNENGVLVLTEGSVLEYSSIGG